MENLQTGNGIAIGLLPDLSLESGSCGKQMQEDKKTTEMQELECNRGRTSERRI